MLMPPAPAPTPMAQEIGGRLHVGVPLVCWRAWARRVKVARMSAGWVSDSFVQSFGAGMEESLQTCCRSFRGGSSVSSRDQPPTTLGRR